MRPPMRSPTELRRLVIVNFVHFINIFSYFRQSVIRTAQDGESAERREIDILRQQLKEALERERVREGIEVDQQFEEQEALDIEFEIMAGNKVKNKDNPGKLIVDVKEKFLFKQKIQNIIHFHCAKKETLKCQMKAKVRDKDGNYSLIHVSQDHNHQDLEGPIVAEKIQNEMKTEYETDFRKTTREVLQSVMNRYQLMNHLLHCFQVYLWIFCNWSNH